jgi:hypothetical protein
MTKIIYFASPDVVEIFDGVIEGGIVYAKDRPIMFDLKDTESLKLVHRTIFGEKSEPLFITAWDSIRPATVKHGIIPTLKKRTPQEPPVGPHKIELIHRYEKLNNPESLYKTMTLRILGNMLRFKRPISPILLLMFGLMIGIMVGFSLFKFGLLR